MPLVWNHVSIDTVGVFVAPFGVDAVGVNAIGVDTVKSEV